MSRVFRGVVRALTENTLKFTGRFATDEARKTIENLKQYNERWEFLENNDGRCVIKRRNN